MPPEPQDTRIRDLAAAFLAAVVARYAATTAGLPERRYTTVGDVAFDCEQLVVSAETVYAGLPGAETFQSTPPSIAFLYTVRFAIGLVRCVPGPTSQGKPPSAANLLAAGELAQIDTREILKAVTKAKTAGDLTAFCQNVGFAGISYTGPSGGFVGILARFDAQL